MEIGSEAQKKVGFLARVSQPIVSLFLWFRSNISKLVKRAEKIGKDDPRRAIHSLKVGMALTLVSLFYYYKPLYSGFGVSAMWAVLTVVVVFEYTVGATLSKGLNRAFATLLAGALGVGAHHLADLSGKLAEPLLLGAFVFLLAAAATFSRFFPKIKARYDYGVVIFILTFSLVAVSGYRVDELIRLAHQRLSTIAIGSFACVFIAIFVCPVWAGEDLHKLIAQNIEKVASFLEGFENEYFKEEGENVVSKEEKSFLQSYRSILNSKATEDSLANFARWEPRHGRFMFRHPWEQYLKIGSLTRQCAYSVEALNACMSSEIKAPKEFQQKIQADCTQLSSESGKALKELASAIRTMTQPISAAHHLSSAKSAASTLKTTLKMDISEINALLEILPSVTVASLLIEVVDRAEELIEAVNELARLTKFKNAAMVTTDRAPSLSRNAIKPLSDDIDSQHIVIDESGPASDSLENGSCQEIRRIKHVCI